VAAFGFTWVILTWVVWRFTIADFVSAPLIGLAISVSHWAVLIVHHLGHAAAAWAAGHPMSGIRLWGWLATSLCPEDEPVLPVAVHIRRAMGGPLASVVFAVGIIYAALGLHSKGNQAWSLLAFVALDSLLIFGFGSLIPLGFNDGSTLIYWFGRKKREQGD
jgi:hypothetical protein